MPITKDTISLPLEAGKSILELKQLPAQLTSALDYVSSRLAQKGLHLSMIVIRKDINILPTSSSPVLPPSPKRVDSATPSVTTSPARSLFSSASSTFTKSLSKHTSNSSISDDATPTASSSSSSTFSRTRWPGLPSSPRLTSTSLSPPASPKSVSPPTSPTLNCFGISLIQTSALTFKAEKILRRIVFKAERKFSIGSGWLSAQPLTKPLTCPATNDLIHRSMCQNEILFCSEGLTLLSLDHVYEFKCQLHVYSRTLSSANLATTVDGLRCLVLSQNGKTLTKAYLMRVYDWLGVTSAALTRVDEAYKTAYGGAARLGAIDRPSEKAKAPAPSVTQTNPSNQPANHRAPPPLNLKTNFNANELHQMNLSIGFAPMETSTSSTFSVGSTTSSGSSSTEASMKELEIGESAKGRDYQAWSLKEDKGPHMRGPMTPNGYEDITPMTKGEWSFLKDGWNPRTAGVETCR